TTNSPPLTAETVFQLMESNGVSWKIYVHPDSTGCTTTQCLYSHSYLNQFTYGKSVLNNLPSRYASTPQLLTYRQNGTLPQVSHTVMDHTAMLKLIETRFNLPSLTLRDAAQPDMTEFFDFVNVPWATPPTPPNQLHNLPCIMEALNSVTISPNPAPAGGQASV